MNERWDGDQTGAGVSNAEAFAPSIRTLLAEMARPDWDTEQPEAHPLPHLERWCGREASPFVLRSAAFGRHGSFVVDLERTEAVPVADARADVYALVATIAEPTTVVVQRKADGIDVFDVTLAVVPGQSTFPKGHGHLVRLRVHPA